MFVQAFGTAVCCLAIRLAFSAGLDFELGFLNRSDEWEMAHAKCGLCRTAGIPHTMNAESTFKHESVFPLRS